MKISMLLEDLKRKDEIRRRFDLLSKDRIRWKRRNRYYYEDQERYFRHLVPEGMKVLELGCGTGDLLNALKPSRGVCVDFSEGMLKVAQALYPHLEFRRDDIEIMDGWGEQFDFVILSDVIGHLQDIQHTFEKIKQFCHQRTRIIISYYNFLWEPILWIGERLRMKMPLHQQNWLSTEDICNLLYIADYQVIKTDRRLLIPKRIPLISDIINRYIAPLPVIRKLCLCCYVVARPLNIRKKRERSVSIIIPCKNERGNIEPTLRRLPVFGSHQEIIFVDGRSQDGTIEEIKRVMKRYADRDIKLLIQDGQGKADAVRKGFLNAKGEILIILDADLSVPPEDLLKFYRVLRDDLGEFANGCRLIYPLERQAMRLLNYMGNKFFSLMFTWILNQRFKDTLCGTKALYREDYKKIEALRREYLGSIDPFGDFELILGAVKQNLKIVEVPVRYHQRRYGKTNIKRFRHGWLLLKMTAFAFKRFKAI